MTNYGESFLLQSNPEFVNQWTTFIQATWHNGETNDISVPNRCHIHNDHFKIQYLDGAADEDIQMRKTEKGARQIHLSPFKTKA